MDDLNENHDNNDLAMGKLLVQHPRNVASEILRLKPDTLKIILEDASGIELIKHIQTFTSYQTDIILMQEHAKKYDISLDDPRYIKSVNSYMDQLLCSIWLNDIDYYRHLLLSESWFSEKFLQDCTIKMIESMDEYEICDYLLTRFGNYLSTEADVKLSGNEYDGFEGFVYLQNYEPSRIAQIAYRAQSNFRKTHADLQDFSNVIWNFLIGFNTGIQRFMLAYKTFETTSHDFKTWKIAMSSLHREAKANIHNLDANIVLTEGDNNTYKFNQPLRALEGAEVTLGCTARMTYAFNRFGEDITRYVEMARNYIKKKKVIK